MQLSPGAQLGTYAIVAGLGIGGMDEVYRARDTCLKREAEMLASLNHPNIAAVYGVEEFDGIKALILELPISPTPSSVLPS